MFLKLYYVHLNTPHTSIRSLKTQNTFNANCLQRAPSNIWIQHYAENPRFIWLFRHPCHIYPPIHPFPDSITSSIRASEIMQSHKLRRDYLKKNKFRDCTAFHEARLCNWLFNVTKLNGIQTSRPGFGSCLMSNFDHVTTLIEKGQNRTHLFFFCCLNIFLRLIIISYSFSSPSLSPSPMIAQVGCKCQGVEELSSLIANIFSISESEREFLKSCLLATIRTGTPWFSDILVILWSSVLASSILSTSTESTTNTMPSVHLVYDFHSGLSFSWPPTSQKWKVTVFELPSVTLIFSVLNPLVGTVLTNSLNCSR